MKCEKFATKFNAASVPEVLFNAMQFTKDRMVSHYNNKNAEGIHSEYRNFRTFTRFLFIRGSYGIYSQLKLYVDTEMGNFMDMLLENERWR